jgi:energy-coupling factor transport system ATP-binding protein
VLGPLDLTLVEGERLAVMGRNGAGKSTLVWSLQGSVPRSGGRITVRARGADDEARLPAPAARRRTLAWWRRPALAPPPSDDPAELRPSARRRLVGLVPQEHSTLLYLESVAAECAQSERESGAPEGTCRHLLERLSPGVSASAHPRDLSEGQRLALALAVTLAAAPAVLLLDEPTRGLDYGAKRRLAALLRELSADGHAVLVTTHDVEFVAEYASRVVLLAEGEIVADATTREFVAASPMYAPQVAKVFAPHPLLTVAEALNALGLTEPIGASS